MLGQIGRRPSTMIEIWGSMIGLWKLIKEENDAVFHSKSIIGRMDRVGAAETVHSSSIPGWVTPKKNYKIFTAFLLDVQQLKGQREISTVCGRQMGR